MSALTEKTAPSMQLTPKPALKLGHVLKVTITLPEESRRVIQMAVLLGKYESCQEFVEKMAEQGIEQLKENLKTALIKGNRKIKVK